VTTISDPEPTTANQIDLKWPDLSDDETGYTVERKTSPGGVWAQIATLPANVTTYSDYGLPAATTFLYRVCATTVTGCSDWSNEASATTFSRDANFTVGGYLGVGPSTPERAIHIKGPNAVFRMDRSQDTAAFMIVRNDAGGDVWKSFVVGVNASGANDGSFVINDLGALVSGAGVNRLTIDNAGTAAFSGQVKATGFVTTSSSRFKQNIQPIFGALAAVTRLQGYRFNWLGSGAPALGLIAEEAAQIVPELAAGDAGQPFGLDYGRLAALLVEGVKCQQAQLDALKQRRDRLERLLQELEQGKNRPAPDQN